MADLFLHDILENLKQKEAVFTDSESAEENETTFESPQISLKTIRRATDKFSESNKLGEGGYGAVYKVTGVTISSSIQLLLFIIIFNKVRRQVIHGTMSLDCNKMSIGPCYHVAWLC